MAHRVPVGMDLFGFRRSPDMLVPAKIPEQAGNNTPKRSLKFSVLENTDPAAPDVNRGIKLFFKVSAENPVKIT